MKQNESLKKELKSSQLSIRQCFMQSISLQTEKLVRRSFFEPLQKIVMYV